MIPIVRLAILGKQGHGETGTGTIIFQYSCHNIGIVGRPGFRTVAPSKKWGQPPFFGRPVLYVVYTNLGLSISTSRHFHHQADFLCIKGILFLFSHTLIMQPVY